MQRLVAMFESNSVNNSNILSRGKPLFVTHTYESDPQSQSICPAVELKIHFFGYTKASLCNFSSYIVTWYYWLVFSPVGLILTCLASGLALSYLYYMYYTHMVRIWQSNLSDGS